MKKENSIKISRASVFFYVAAVIFLVIAVFYLYVTYQSIVEYKQTAEPTMQSIFSAYLGNCAPFFAYAIVSYGIGLIIAKVAALTSTLSLCVEDAQEEESETDIDSVETTPLEPIA